VDHCKERGFLGRQLYELHSHVETAFSASAQPRFEDNISSRCLTLSDLAVGIGIFPFPTAGSAYPSSEAGSVVTGDKLCNEDVREPVDDFESGDLEDSS
jgi:hypothetical protein